MTLLLVDRRVDLFILIASLERYREAYFINLYFHKFFVSLYKTSYNERINVMRIKLLNYIMACKFRESGHKLSFVNITVKVYRLSDYIYIYISQNLQVTSLYGIYIIL